jgi:hypothetical protein
VINTITNDGLELKKLNSLFPEPRFAKIIEEYEIEGISNSESVKNPFHETQTRILLSNLLKVTIDQEKILNEMVNKNNVDNNGRIIW